MAITRLPFIDTYGVGEINVTIINPKNNKSVKIPLEFDTGAPQTVLPNKFARTLGVNWNDGQPVRNDEFHLFKLGIKVGSLKSFLTPVLIRTGGEKNITLQVMGYYTMSQFKRIRILENSIIFEDNAPNPTPYPILSRATYVSGTRREEGPEFDNAYFYHPVTFYNKKTGRPIVIKMEVDTGTEYPILPPEYAKRLGIDDVTKGYVDKYTISTVYFNENTVYEHEIWIKLGNLKPIKTRIDFIEDDYPLLGLKDILKKVRVEITGEKLSYTEIVPPTPTKQAAYAYIYDRALSRYRGRL